MSFSYHSHGVYPPIYHAWYSSSNQPSLICTPPPQIAHCVQHAPILYAHNVSSCAYGQNDDDDSYASSDDDFVRDFVHPTKSDLCDKTFDCKVKVTFHNDPSRGYTYYLENKTLKMKSQPFKIEQLENFIQQKHLNHATWITGKE